MQVFESLSANLRWPENDGKFTSPRHEAGSEFVYSHSASERVDLLLLTLIFCIYLAALG